MISCQTLVQIIEQWAPRKLAMDWDNPGLALGDLSGEISKVLLTLTVTSEIIEFAAKNGYEMIISHHPLFFKPLKSLKKDTPIGKIVYKAIKNDIVIYSAHTNMDITSGGINDILAHLLNLEQIQVLKQTCREKLNKLAVFVPRGYEDAVRNAICDAGAGHIGNYSHCSFSTDGFGTFKPLEGTNPFIGEHNKLQRADEIRIETIVPESLQKKVISAMIKAHPYEEVAFDIYPLDNPGEKFGLGRIGYTKEPVTLKDFCEIVKHNLNTSYVRVVGDVKKSISKVAVCGGAGGDLIPAAAFFGADVLVTGDVKYHEALDAKESGLAIIDAGHFATETILLPALKEHLEEQTKLLNKQVEISIFEDSDPFVIV
ncbi:MAG: Nif3-like dinuclear metal center hexameric protein [Thermoanaerobacteraceae bacterium]|nr:Nif3-like dinuclear metal center hexameric protein [Thermoanaerobacteraceae bacterium]